MSEPTQLGDKLRAARERMGLGVDQAAERLHVDAQVIDALETGKFKKLGAPVFVRGHLKHYAELLGEPEGPLQEELSSLKDVTAAPDLTAVPKLPAQPVRAPRRRWPLVAFAIALGLAVLVWWAMGVKLV